MGTWMNNDGLYIKYGTDRATDGTTYGKAGAFAAVETGQVVIEATINLSTLGTAAAVIDDNCIIPKGMRVQKVEIVTTTAATSGGAAVLNIGILKRDRTTEGDYDGYIAALALASFNAVGETSTYTAGVTGAGALVGTSPDYSGYLTADYDTAAFTAGVIKVRIFLQKL